MCRTQSVQCVLPAEAALCICIRFVSLLRNLRMSLTEGSSITGCESARKAQTWVRSAGLSLPWPPVLALDM